MKATIFYSWQSDFPTGEGKEFLRSALEEAIARMSQDATLVIRPELDHDTQGIPGSPSMAAAILRKIDESSVFVADVSLSYGRLVGPPSRRSPNPNVLLELGYALKRLGHERILLLVNSAHGSPEELPFDLRGNRVVSFNTGSREELVEDLRNSLRLIVTKAGLPADVLAPVQIKLKRRDEEIGNSLHRYRLPVRVLNAGDEILANWAVEVSFPRAVLEANKSYPIVRESPGKMVVMRQIEVNHSGPLYPGEEKEVLGIDYYMDDRLFSQGEELFEKQVTASFYVGNRRVAQKSVEFRELQCY